MICFFAVGDLHLLAHDVAYEDQQSFMLRIASTTAVTLTIKVIT